MPTAILDHLKLIARLSPTRRTAVLDYAVRQAGPTAYVLVEYGPPRLEDATLVVGTLIGVAWTTGSGASNALLVRPFSSGHRIHAIGAALVNRITRVTVVSGGADNDPVDEFGIPFRREAIIAGPHR